MKYWQRNEYFKYASFIRECERAYGIPRDMLAILLWDSSQFKQRDIESKHRHRFGSIGIANIMHAAGKQWGMIDEQKGRDDRYNPWAAIRAAGTHLATLRGKMGSWRLAVLAYKWGDENLRIALQAERTEQYPCPPETLRATERLLSMVTT